jgi:ribose transport system substrate-binding protein
MESFKPPPTSSPPPQPDKNIWIITLGLAQDASADFDRGATEAGKLLGWQTTSCDGEFSPDKWAQCIRQAVTDKADGIALYVIDCASIQAPLKQARQAGLTVVSAEAPDCSDQKKGAAPLFDAKISFTQGDFADWLGAQIQANADWIIANTDGEAKIIELHETDAWALNLMHEVFQEEIATLCPNCEIVEEIEFIGADLEGPLREKTEQALLKHPDANVVAGQYDDPALTVAPAVRQAKGQGRELYSTGGVGGQAAMDLIRQDGGIDAGYVYDIEWEGFHAMDTLNRLFAGEKPVPSGVGVGMVDRERNLPPAGEGWTTEVDFKSGYRKAWGVDG